MNLEEIKKIAEKGKKGLKKTLTAAAIMAAVTACGPSDKKDETTTPPESTKTEVAKDSTKTVIPQDNTEASNDKLAELDEILEEADEAHAEIQAELKKELEKTLKELNLTKKEYAKRTEAYKNAEEGRDACEITFKKLCENPNIPRDNGLLSLVNKIIHGYKETIKILNEPESEPARRTQELYKQKAAEAKANK